MKMTFSPISVIHNNFCSHQTSREYIGMEYLKFFLQLVRKLRVKRKKQPFIVLARLSMKNHIICCSGMYTNIFSEKEKKMPKKKAHPQNA